MPSPNDAAGTATKRRMTASVTITPAAKTRDGETGPRRISDPAQLAMVQAAILQMKPPGVLTRWLNEGKCTKAHYSSEMGESNHAHFQGWHQWETEQPQSEVPDALLELARTTMGSKKKDQEQKVRNTREKKAISELRQCAAVLHRARVSACQRQRVCLRLRVPERLRVPAPAAGGYGQTWWWPSSTRSSARTRA
jgi:hypothetical protein